MTHAAAVEAAHAQPLSQLPREMPVSKPGPTLAQMQVRVFRILLVWPSIALGVIVGWLVALLVAAAQSGNGVFGLGGAVAVLTFVPNLLALSCFVIGAAMSAVQGRRVRSLVRRSRAARAVGPLPPPCSCASRVRRSRSMRTNCCTPPTLRGSVSRPSSCRCPTGLLCPRPAVARGSC